MTEAFCPCCTRPFHRTDLVHAFIEVYGPCKSPKILDGLNLTRPELHSALCGLVRLEKITRLDTGPSRGGLYSIAVWAATKPAPSILKEKFLATHDAD